MPIGELSSVLPYIAVIILLYLISEAHTAKNRIWCSFRRKDRTKIYKWAKRSKNGNFDDVEFEGGLYHVEPDRTVFQWKTVLGFFPIGVRAADFRHDSARALDPDTFDNSYTPEQRKQLNISDDVRQFSEGNNNAIGGKMKKSMFDNIMPFVMIGGLLIVGYLVYQQGKNIALLGHGQNYIEQQLGVIRQQTGNK